MRAIKELKKILNKLRDTGMPIIILQDCLTKKPSITFTMLLINFSLCIAALIGGVSEAFGGIDFKNATDLLWITGGLYFGRKFQKIEDTSKETEENKC